MSDPAAQLAALRILRTTITDSAQAAALDAAIAALEAQQLREHHQTIEGNASIGVAVAGNVHGSISHTEQIGGINFGSGNSFDTIGHLITGGVVQGDIVGRDQINIMLFFTAAGITNPSAEQHEFVTSYLVRLARRCDRLRILGAVRRERRGASTLLTLSQVYVTLASETWVTIEDKELTQAFADKLKPGIPEIVPSVPTRRTTNVHLIDDLIPNRSFGKGVVSGLHSRVERPLLLTEAGRHADVVLVYFPVVLQLADRELNHAVSEMSRNTDHQKRHDS